MPAPRFGFAGFRFPPDVIMVAVRWYLRYGLSANATLDTQAITVGARVVRKEEGVAGVNRHVTRLSADTNTIASLMQ
jgi:transposase-like protein